MELPVVINAYEDGAPMPESIDSHLPPRLVPRMKAFIHGETLQPGSASPEDPADKSPSALSRSQPNSSALGSHVASLYRSLVDKKAPNKRSKPSSAVPKPSQTSLQAKPPPIEAITVHGSASESSSSSSSSSLDDSRVSAVVPPPPESFCCEWCNATVCVDDAEEHLRSTVHRFNMQYRPARGIYYLNESNLGFRMLKDMNWTEEEGLGAQGQGRLEPIKTRIKNDKVGLGGPTSQPLRVTHKEEEMAKERERRQRLREEKRRGRAGKGRREQRARAAQERTQERRIREEVYADYPLM